jgi:hypothetical protein
VFFRTLGEDYGVDGKSVFNDLNRALATAICADTNHHPHPCLDCLQRTYELTTIVAQTIYQTASSGRRAKSLDSYSAAGHGLEWLTKRVEEYVSSLR